jgi:hypothetical protein
MGAQLDRHAGRDALAVPDIVELPSLKELLGSSRPGDIVFSLPRRAGLLSVSIGRLVVVGTAVWLSRSF